MRQLVIWIAGVAMLLLLFVVDVVTGSVSIPLASIVEAMTEGNDSLYHTIIFDIRLPKALTAICVGSALSLSGLWMQTLFRNPLVGPYVLGISSGATLGVSLYLFVFSLLGISSVFVSSWGMALRYGGCSVSLLDSLIGLLSSAQFRIAVDCGSDVGKCGDSHCLLVAAYQ